MTTASNDQYRQLEDGYALVHLDRGNSAVNVDLQYPRIEGHARRVVIGLEDVRAADDITIEYDFDRDGWSVTREIYTDGDGVMIVALDGRRIEVAFVAAWTEPLR